MVGRKSFLTELKHQCHLFYWGEKVYGAHSWKDKRLLCESIFVPINKWTLTLKNGMIRSFSYEPKASIHLS